ncbi:cellulose binding domain-containing protein [Streptomyces sp. NPDC098789]|uniref:cellulose binding domain-containing protein n=1 Tax=Streptomyces sp. NPDC098789 TaxID=3366098 RepID=UPI00380151C5
MTTIKKPSRLIIGLCTAGLLTAGAVSTALATAPTDAPKPPQAQGTTLKATAAVGVEAGGKLTGSAWYKNGQFDITNHTDKPVSDWKIEFDLDGASAVQMNYGATASHNGKHWVISAAKEGGTIQPGQKASITFGINGDGKSDISFTNTTVNGQAFTFDDGASSAQDDHKALPKDPLESGKYWVSDSSLAADVQVNSYNGGATVNVKLHNGGSKTVKNWTVAYGVDPGTKVVGPWGADVTVSEDQKMIIIHGGSLQPGADAGSIGFSTKYDPNDPSVPETPVAPAKNPHLAKSAPYVDPTLGQGDGTISLNGKAVTIADYLKQTGAEDVTLAFLQADSKTGKPSWAGNSTHNFLAKQINEIRTAGHDVVASFGGQAGKTLWSASQDVDKLAKQYEEVITRYNLTKLDFDMEGGPNEGNTPNNQANGKALAKVQAWAKQNNRPLWISATLPVLPTGLTADGKGSLKSMTDAGVEVSRVNIMQMDYGPSGIDMGKAGIDAGVSLKGQLKEFFPGKSDQQLYGMMGFTPMIGHNDVAGEIFTLDNAKTLRKWADGNGVGMVSMWAAGRDQTGRTGQAGPDQSGIQQSPLDFSKILFGGRK